ncbi:MAG: glycosyltransferase family 4 protein [Verrucomicrobia bacterium]|nr:glycosyltransferase family 4 protein [Verrucomicrobiota bacterium]
MNPNPAAAHVAVAQIGARRHYAIPRILHDVGRLAGLYTDFCAEAWPWPGGALGGSRWAGVPRKLAHAFPLFALKRALRARRARTPAQRLRAYEAWNGEFGHLVAATGLGQARAVYAFNAAALEIFEYARAHALVTLLDQTAAPWEVDETLLAEERQRWPGWEFDGTAPGDWGPLAERERQEWALADRIICGSDYVREALDSVSGPAEKCRVIPYGLEENQFTPRVKERVPGPLRVLFVGAIQLRKGVQYLVDAARSLRPGAAELRLVGPVRVSGKAANELRSVAEILPPVPRTSLQAVYDAADVLVLPTLSEGSANVCYEALACGLPVVTTPNAGSVVRDGVEGFIVPIRSPQDIADRLGRLAGDRELLVSMSAQAAVRSREFTRAQYAQRLLAAFSDILPS